jgi:hypothetical protein
VKLLALTIYGENGARSLKPRRTRMIEIKNIAGDVIFTSEKETLKEALEEAVSQHTVLNGAFLNGAFLNRAVLDGAFLDGASLNGASLNRASLDGASLNGAFLNRAFLEGASLNRAVLNRASLNGAESIVSFGPVGKERRMGYAVDHGDKVMVQLGCWWGDAGCAVQRIQDVYAEGPMREAYIAGVLWAQQQIEVYRKVAK